MNEHDETPVTRQEQALAAIEDGYHTPPARPAKYAIPTQAITHGVLARDDISEATSVVHRAGLPDAHFAKYLQAAINVKHEIESSGRTHEMLARRTLESLRDRHGANAGQMLVKFESVAKPLRESPAHATAYKFARHSRPLIELFAAHWDYTHRKSGS